MEHSVALQSLDRIRKLPIWMPAILCSEVRFEVEETWYIVLTCLGTVLQTEKDVEKIVQFVMAEGE